MLIPLQKKLPRFDLLGNPISDSEVDDKTLDEHESKRLFYRSIRNYLVDKAEQLGNLRLRYGLPSHIELPDGDYTEIDDSYFSGIYNLSTSPPPL